MQIFLYTNYRAWVGDSIEELKKVKPFISIRYICQKQDLDPGNFVRVLQGKLNFTKPTILALSNFFELDKREAEYFEELVFYAKTKTDKAAWESFQRLQQIKNIEVKVLADYDFEYFDKWYHSVVRSLLSITPFNGNFRALAGMLTPSISVNEAKESIALLEKLGMLKKEKGFWEVTDKFLGSGQKFSKQSIRQYQAQTLQLAQESLELHDPNDRDISTVTVTLTKDELPIFKERAKQFRQEILKMAKKSVINDSVYQVNVSIFPVAFTKKRGK